MTASNLELEARAYGPDSTPEEIAAIRARVTVREGIIFYHELPVMSVFSIDVAVDRVEELCRASGATAMLVDVSGGGRPDAAARKRILERLRELQDQLDHIAVVISANPLAMVAAKFVQAVIPIEYSVHRTRAEAEETLRNAAR